MEIRSKVSAGSIFFVGLDDVEKVKSITPAFAKAFDIVWIEEATQVSEDDFEQLRLRMRGNSKFRKKMILTFNPIHKEHWIYKRWFKDKTEAQTHRYRDDELLIMRTTYKDNRFLDEDEKRALEDTKKRSPYHYMVYALGEFGVLGKRIYENWREEHFNADKLKHLPLYLGGDFGFTNDQTAFTMCRYDAENKRIYIFDEIYKRGLLSEDIAKEVKIKIALHNISAYTSFWDSARPDQIRTLVNKGVRARKTYKNEILDGIDWLMQHEIIVHPRCKNTINELNLFVWEEKDGEPINKPKGGLDHLMDALRYAFNQLWSNSGKVVGGKSGLY
jgi:phage terminase large subunit